MSKDDDFVQEMTELVMGMAKSLVDHPSEVKLAISGGSGQTYLFSLKCAKMDMGQIIGKQGKTAAAIRQILSSAAMKHSKRAILDVEE